MYRRKRKPLVWKESQVISSKVNKLVFVCQLTHIKKNRVFCYESIGAKTRAIARIWGLSRIWQQSLDLEPAYALEVISEKFNRLSGHDQDKVLIHELLHIPKNFSGALLPHKRKGGVNEKLVFNLYKKYLNSQD